MRRSRSLWTPSRPSSAAAAQARPAARRGRTGADFDASLLRRALVAVVALKVAGVVLIFDPGGLQAFDLPKSLYSRAFEWLLAGLLVLTFLRYGLAVVPRAWLHLFVAAYALATVVAGIFAEDRYVALFGEQERYLGLTFLADMLVLYLAVTVAFRHLGDWALLVAAVGLAGVLSVGYGAAQLLGLDPIPWSPSPRTRPFGTFGHPDMFGQFLGVAFAVSLGIGATASGTHARTIRIAAALGALLALGAATVVATRGSALALAATLALFPLVVARLRSLPAKAMPRLAASGLFVAIAVTALVFVSPLGGRLRATAQGVAVEDRLVIYENALRAFVDRPLFGWGPDGFAVAYPHYRQAREIAIHGVNALHTSAHDWPLHAAVTTGSAGLLALLALLGAFARSLWTRGLAHLPTVAAPLLLGSAAYWAHGLVTVESIGLDWVAWVGFAGAVACAGERPPVPPPVRRVRPFGQALVLAAAVAGALSVLPALRANEEAQQARAALRVGNAAPALAAAEAAVRLDPGRARYWVLLGAARDLREEWHRAADAYAEAVRRAPHMASYWSNLARSRTRQVLAGDAGAEGRDSALAAARRATEVDPNEPWPYAELADVAAAFGDFGLAFRAATTAISLYQGEPEFDRIAARIAVRNPDARASRAFLEGLLGYKDTATLRLGAAQLALRLGDAEAARANAQRALELDPGNADARSLLRSLGD